MCKAQALRKAYFDLLRGIDQRMVSSSKYGICFKLISSKIPLKFVIYLVLYAQLIK